MLRGSWKPILGLVVGAFVLILAGYGGKALAQCCAPPPPSPCCAPPTPPPCCAPPVPPTPPSNPCCTPPGHSINVPGINVSVGASVVVNVNAVVNATATAIANSQGSGQGSGYGSGRGAVYFGGGGFGGGMMPAPASVIAGLNVEGARAKRRVAYEATREKTTKVVIRAFCLDDRQVPHPASQLFPEKDIESDFEGEFYRCLAGTRLQYVVAEYHGQVDIGEGGETIVCEKGDSLYHVRGGRVECRRQAPARDCNERSLLRRFGAGVKILTMTRIEKYTAYREEEVETSSSSVESLTLSGGVGGIAY